MSLRQSGRKRGRVAINRVATHGGMSQKWFGVKHDSIPDIVRAVDGLVPGHNSVSLAVPPQAHVFGIEIIPFNKEIVYRDHVNVIDALAHKRFAPKDMRRWGTFGLFIDILRERYPTYKIKCDCENEVVMSTDVYKAALASGVGSCNVYNEGVMRLLGV